MTKDPTLRAFANGEITANSVRKTVNAPSLKAVGIEGSELEVQTLVEKAQHGDVYLLCSDGLNRHVTDAEINEILAKVSQGTLTPNAATKQLIDTANVDGGSDNITAIIAYVLRKRA